MHTALRTVVLAAVAGLAVLFGTSSSAQAATASTASTVKEPTRDYSLMSSADGRALASHLFYPSLATAVAEAYDGSSRMQWGVVPRAGASDALLVNRLTGACLTASGWYAVQATCGSAATQGWSFVFPSVPDHIERLTACATPPPRRCSPWARTTGPARRWSSRPTSGRHPTVLGRLALHRRPRIQAARTSGQLKCGSAQPCHTEPGGRRGRPRTR